jgi:trehalose/maltose transport system substrate-binding protein
VTSFDKSANDKKIAGLLRDFRSGSINRRELITRGMALGVSAYFLGRIATDSAFAQDATPEAIAPGSTLTSPSGFDQSLAGQSITVVLGSDGPGTPWEEAAVAQFTADTGVNVNRISGAQSATDRLANYLQILNAEASDIDAMMIDVIWPGILAPHAIDLNPALADVIGNYFPAIVENNTVDGALVGVPWYTDAGLLYSRTDLLEKYSVGVPATWDELATSAQTIQDGERAADSAFWGFVWQGNAYEGLTCDALEWVVSNGGGNLIEPDGTISINNPSAAAALDRAAGWVGTISPEGVTTHQEEDARLIWQDGHAAFMRNWPYAYATGQEAGSVIAGKFQVGLLPMGDGEGARNAACLGGWQMMASKYSKSPDAAVLFARYMTAPEIQKSAAIERSLLPTIGTVYDDADVLAQNPYYADLKPVFQGGAVPRPSTVTSSAYNDISTAFFTGVHNVLTGSTDGASAVADIEGEFQELMDELNA